MFYETELLKMKVLMYFKQNDETLCTVSKMSERLGLFKQKISKILIQLDDEGLVDRSNNRHPVLTEKGNKLATDYVEKMRMTIECLLYQGAKMEDAEKDAYNIVLFASESTTEIIKKKYGAIKLKVEVGDLYNFKGEELIPHLEDGMYSVDFLIYRQNPDYNKLLSMANNGFEHPGHLFVENGIGKVKLKIKDVKMKAPYKDGFVKGQAAEVRYLQNGKYVKAETLGSIIALPLEAMDFTVVGNEENKKLHGSLFIKIVSTINTAYMPESEAIFTVII